MKVARGELESPARQRVSVSSSGKAWDVHSGSQTNLPTLLMSDLTKARLSEALQSRNSAHEAAPRWPQTCSGTGTVWPLVSHCHKLLLSFTCNVLLSWLRSEVLHQHKQCACGPGKVSQVPSKEWRLHQQPLHKTYAADVTKHPWCHILLKTGASGPRDGRCGHQQAVTSRRGLPGAARSLTRTGHWGTERPHPHRVCAPLSVLPELREHNPFLCLAERYRGIAFVSATWSWLLCF